jgi:O-methyltransferase involved in polyketide biosynthesis
VQRTLLLPLWGRAVESRKPSPLLTDPQAARIVDALDHDFSTIQANLSPITQLAWIARCIHLDRAVRAFVGIHPRATVVNLGCGLDTTFPRVDNGTLAWVDVDLPDVMRLRASLIPVGPRCRSVAGSILDDDWMRDLRVGEGLLFLAAGVLYYFEEGRVRGLFARLADAFPGSEIVFDACSPRGLEVANRRVIRDLGMDEEANLRWAVARPSDLAAWDRRIEVAEAYPIFHGITGRLPWRQRLGPWLSDALRIMSMVRLRFSAAAVEAAYGFTPPGTAPFAVQPPSTTRLCPVTCAAASESRKSAAAATSPTEAALPSGVTPAHPCS